MKSKLLLRCGVFTAQITHHKFIMAENTTQNTKTLKFWTNFEKNFF